MSNKTVISSIEGTYTAKIQNHRDFAATRLSAYHDVEQDFFYFMGEEGESPLPGADFRLLHIHVTKDGGDLKFQRLDYIIKVNGDQKRYWADEGDFTIDFDEAIRHYKMSFHVSAKYISETIDILGSFDLMQK